MAPSQTMNLYSYIDNDVETDVETLLKFGVWNEELKEQWINEADYILVERRLFIFQWMSRVESGELTILAITNPVESCRGKDSQILIIIKNPDITNEK